MTFAEYTELRDKLELFRIAVLKTLCHLRNINADAIDYTKSYFQLKNDNTIFYALYYCDSFNACGSYSITFVNKYLQQEINIKGDT